MVAVSFFLAVDVDRIRVQAEKTSLVRSRHAWSLSLQFVHTFGCSHGWVEGSVVVHALEAVVEVIVETRKLLGDPPWLSKEAVPLGLELPEHRLAGYWS